MCGEQTVNRRERVTYVLKDRRGSQQTAISLEHAPCEGFEGKASGGRLTPKTARNGSKKGASAPLAAQAANPGNARRMKMVALVGEKRRTVTPSVNALPRSSTRYASSTKGKDPCRTLPVLTLPVVPYGEACITGL